MQEEVTESKPQQWQLDLQNGFRNLQVLLTYLEIHPSEWPISMDEASLTNFKLKVPLSFAQRMAKKNPHDPLLLQVAIQNQELLVDPKFKRDAVGDLHSIKTKGLLQKYHGRVLIIATGICAVHCRYCFRKHFPYQEQILSEKDRASLLDYIESDPTIEEVIFSGGDPLLLSNQLLFWWSEQLRKIPTLKRWRFHTRIPSVLPQRIDQECINAMLHFRNHEDRQIILVSHINHPQEINTEVADTLKFLSRSQILLLNQSVLLKNINDNVRVLKDLSLKLIENHTFPYYLHLLDRTEGCGHFEVSEESAFRIYRDLSSQLPGYALPRLVREIEGHASKTLMTPPPLDCAIKATESNSVPI